MYTISAIFALIACASAQGPGDGIAKATYTSSDPVKGLNFMLKYLPTTVAEDSCSSNYCKPGSFPDGEKWQGRAQLIQPFTGMIERNCQLYSAASTYTATTGAVNIVAATSKGENCGYYSGYAFNTDTAKLIHAAYAHNQDTCCKACAATTGCTAATYTPEPSSTTSSRKLLQPMAGEGFGLHLVDVVASKTTGGLSVSDLEAKYTLRLGDFSKFDAFMDYSVQLYTANLPAYATTFSNDKVPHLLGSWATETGETWYSLFVRVPGSQMVLEIIGNENPTTTGLGGEAMTPLEARLSPRNVKLYATYKKDKNNLLYAASVSRATSNITAIEDFYTNVIKATVVQSVDLPKYEISRRCFQWPTATSDVCFTSRPGGQTGQWTVKMHEDNFWSVHRAVMTAPSVSDKYNDNHYAVDTHVSGDYIATYFTANNPFPLKKDSRFAFACAQDYIVDPTGWTIQTDLFFTKAYPGCGWGKQEGLVTPISK